MSVLLDPNLATSVRKADLWGTEDDPVGLTSTYCEENDNPNDVLYDGHYFGVSVHPYETMFLKANRGISDVTMAMLTGWHLKRPVNSWDFCRA